MHIKSLKIKNYRRLKDVSIDLDKETSIFVGANNSGKTSATHILSQFLEKNSDKDSFKLYDFHASCWDEFNQIGKELLEDNTKKIEKLPSIIMDLWFVISEPEVYRIIDLLPSLEWENTPVGVRLQWQTKNVKNLLDDFIRTSDDAKKNQNDSNSDINNKITPWPANLCDYLKKNLTKFYSIYYYVLDHSNLDNQGCFPTNINPPILLEGTGGACKQIIDKLIRLDVMHAQRHLTDKNSTHSSVRSENLSKRFSQFYKSRNKNNNNNHAVMVALHESERQMNTLFDVIFGETLKTLEKLGIGHPNLNAPKLEIRSAMHPERILTNNAEVHYTLNPENPDNPITLPDQYNGLGFKNLIYITLELLDCREQWLSEPDAPPLHLVIIEEPEAHLHIQLQQVFIKHAYRILNNEMNHKENHHNQLIITTHSPHILYEHGFSSIRYFSRTTENRYGHQSKVLSLSEFQNENSDKENNNFLRQYMKLTHCDLFFSDAVILVEGNVERLLLPLMINNVATDLNSKYLSILEVGGAYAYRFRSLIEFLGIKALIITDLDSVSPKTNHSACKTAEQNAITSNQTLIQWLPKKCSIKELFEASDDEKIQLHNSNSQPMIRVAYQTLREITWGKETEKLAGRTLEEMFALENLVWCQDPLRKNLNLYIKDLNTIEDLNTPISLSAMHEALYEKVKNNNFKKTEFALNLIMQSKDINKVEWHVPYYIKEGLEWLQIQLQNNDSADLPSDDSNDIAYGEIS